jgi:predicted unusual protein kinase regulating ubiquinone biosynthesis (AarF/ABC1/UbiB family)
MTALVDLMFMEMFELRMVQTDPNFANYQYHAATGEIVLLDFGATRKFKAGFVNDYRKLAAAAMRGDEDKVLAFAERLGYVIEGADEEYHNLVLNMITTVLEPLSIDEPYDFARSDIARRMSEMGEDVANFRDYWQAPPSDMVYFHRKLGGMFLLVARVRARVNVHQLIQRFLP